MLWISTRPPHALIHRLASLKPQDGCTTFSSEPEAEIIRQPLCCNHVVVIGAPLFAHDLTKRGAPNGALLHHYALSVHHDFEPKKSVRCKPFLHRIKWYDAVQKIFVSIVQMMQMISNIMYFLLTILLTSRVSMYNL